MKSISILSILLLSTCSLFGQEIAYQKTLEDALSLSAKEHKPLFILITTPVMNIPARADFSTGLDAKEVAGFYNKKFINYKVSMTDSAAAKLRSQYHPNIFPTYLFLDANGALVYRSSGNARASEKYLDMANAALARIASGKTLSYYQQLSMRNITASQLRDYIALKQELELFDNAALADEYVNFLQVKDFEDYDKVLFVLKAGPYAYGKAYKLCYTNPQIMDSIFRHEPLATRVAINNHITANTLEEAIRSRNEQMAQNAASFARGIWGKNYTRANQSYAYNMMAYYQGIKDTTRYYLQASSYYDFYYLNISADSAKKLQQQALQNVRQTLKIDNRDTAAIKINAPSGEKLTMTRRVVAIPQGLEVANTLNNAAYTFYSFGTHNTGYLIKALLWVRRAIALQANPGYYDTLAHIMYRLNFYDEAALNQNKAIDMAIHQGRPPAEIARLRDELTRISARQL